MKKRLMSILLCAAMTTGLVAGCGGGDAGTSTDANTGSGNAAGTESGSDSASTSDLEHVTLHFIFFGDKKSATDEVWDAIADYTKDTLNCDFDVQFIAGDDYKQKFS